jgi:hypothetical protein
MGGVLFTPHECIQRKVFVESTAHVLSFPTARSWHSTYSQYVQRKYQTHLEIIALIATATNLELCSPKVLHAVFEARRADYGIYQLRIQLLNGIHE